MNSLSDLLRQNSTILFKMAVIFPKKFKMNEKPPYVVDNSHVHQHFQFHANPATVLKLSGFKQQWIYN